jgi:hypothetical protein
MQVATADERHKRCPTNLFEVAVVVVQSFIILQKILALYNLSFHPESTFSVLRMCMTFVHKAFVWKSNF